MDSPESGSQTRDFFVQISCDPSVKEMRLKLRTFFTDPLQKICIKKQLPYNFLIQLIKIVLVTLQVYFFASHRHTHAEFVRNHQITFQHLFLKNWDPAREIETYPPALGAMAIYEIDDFYSTIDFAFEKYSNLNTAIGNYSYDGGKPFMELCVDHKKSPSIETRCYNLCQISELSGDFSSKKALKDETIDFNALLRADLLFSVQTTSYKYDGLYSSPNCFNLSIDIVFNNVDLDGQMFIRLNTDHKQINCSSGIIPKSNSEVAAAILRTVLNFTIITICSLSLILCTRSIIRAQKLQAETNYFFIRYFSVCLCSSDKKKFINWWYVVIIVNDVLIISGSFMKNSIEYASFEKKDWNSCGLLLGIGDMLVWFGVLRYLSFFRNYNIVILTLEKAAPQVGKFLICAALIFFGFTFSGWLIFGPYHLKFRTLFSTAECLFSLINGDDMFATFSIMSKDSANLWLFSKLYLYIFISLYIYVILSTFISVIDGAYDTVTSYYTDGFPKSELEKFIEEDQDLERELSKLTFKQFLGTIIKCICCGCMGKCRKRLGSQECLIAR